MQNLPYTEGDQSGEGEEEEVANSVIGRLCERGARRSACVLLWRLMSSRGRLDDYSAHSNHEAKAREPAPPPHAVKKTRIVSAEHLQTCTRDR